MVSIVHSNLLTSHCDVIAHQVNCKGVMGAGLAKQIRTRYPNVYMSYKKACDTQSELLGKVQLCTTPDSLVANLFAQWDYGVSRKQTDYDALELCLIKLRDRMLQLNLKTLGLPYGLGCGLAGGSWQIVYKIIQDVFATTDITVYICKL